MSTGGKTSKRIGLAILRVLAEHAIEAIPVYGPYLKIGVESVKTVKEELDKDLPLTLEEMLDSIRMVTSSEVMATIDSMLKSPEGLKNTANLSPAQLQELRRQLLQVPSELDRIISEIEAEERKAAEAAARAEQEQRNRKIQQLHVKLKDQLKKKTYQQAFETAEHILNILPDDREALKVHAWLEKRVGRGILHDVVVGAAFGLGLDMLTALSNGGTMDGDTALGVVIVCAFIALIASV